MQLIEHSTLGPYRLEKPDTAGTAFHSWRARRIATGEAIRVTFPSHASDGEEITPAEAEAIERSLGHVREIAIPGILAACPHWEDGMFFAASPVPAGRSLADMIQQGWPERLEERLGIAALLANLIATAHENGVAHGQLAPEMVYLHSDGQLAVLECGIHPMLAGGHDRAVRADVSALGRMLFRYFAGEWPETGGEAAQARNLRRLPNALPRSMARKILAAANGSATEVPSARNLAIHLALDKAWVKAMAESHTPEVEEMPKDSPNTVRVTITESPMEEDLPFVSGRQFTPAGAPRRPLAALSPSTQAGAISAKALTRKLVMAGAASTLLIAAASLMVLRPRATTPPPAPKLSLSYSAQEAVPARLTYAVRVGPYHDPVAVQKTHQRLRGLGFEPILIYGTEGTYLRALTTPEEPKATQVARGLKQDGLTSIVTETGPESGLLKAVDAAVPQFRIDGVRVDFEGGQSKGWEIGGSAVGMRNSSLFSFRGEHSLEVALRNTSQDAPGVLRLKPESVVLPQDRFVAYVLQPTAASGRLGAALYLIDARGKIFRNMSQPLQAENWVELQYVVSPHVSLPIQEIGVEFRAPREPWTGAVYLDNVIQQRPR